MNNATTFTPGKAYFTRSICDYDCIIEILVAKRTAKTVTTSDGKTLRIRMLGNVEAVRPWGNYSMSPTIDATELRTEAR